MLMTIEQAPYYILWTLMVDGPLVGAGRPMCEYVLVFFLYRDMFFSWFSFLELNSHLTTIVQVPWNFWKPSYDILFLRSLSYSISFSTTIHGRNPAAVDMINIPLFTGFFTSQVVQDFFHQQYLFIAYLCIEHMSIILSGVIAITAVSCTHWRLQ